MKNVVVVGSQWGDEGKGKIVDWLSDQADIVIRFQGGHNAGHTLVIDGVTYKLRLLPSGIVRKGKISIIGNGVVVDPWALLEEIKEIKSKGVDVNKDNFLISESANLILPFHREMDEIREDAAGKSKIGTTRRGIGPAYEDKVGRRSIRVMDLRSENNLDHRLETVLLHHNAIRKGLGKKIYEKNQLKKDLLKIAPEILKFSQPVWLRIDEFKKKEKKMSINGKDKRFNGTKGYGFIERDDKEKDVFVHSSAARDANLELNEGDALTFEVENGEKGPSAVNLQKA